MEKDPFACCSVLFKPSFHVFSRDSLDHNCFSIAWRFHSSRSRNSAAVVPVLHIAVWGKSLVLKTTDWLLDPQLHCALKEYGRGCLVQSLQYRAQLPLRIQLSNDATRQSGLLTPKSTCLYRNSLTQISHCEKNHQNCGGYHSLLTKHNQKCHGCLGKLFWRKIDDILPFFSFFRRNVTRQSR